MKYILSLGSNIGDRENNLKTAVKLLKERFNLLKISSIYESEPWEMKTEKNFYNICVEIETDIKPLELLDILEEIERKMGRENKGEKKDRIIDIDIILNENNIFLSRRLRIPHKFLKERLFYLLPASEIDENLSEPVSNKSLKKLIEECKDKNRIWKTGITLE